MNLKKIIYLPLLFLILGFQRADKQCLEAIKIGRFKYVGDTDNIIIRDKREQIESFNNNSSFVISKISWVNEREYTLTVKKTINCPISEFAKKGVKIKVKIIECFDTYYTCQIEYGEGQVINAKYLNIINQW